MLLNPMSIGWINFSDHREMKTIVGQEVDEYWMDVKFLPKWFDSIYLEWAVPEEWKALDPKFTVFIGNSEEGPFREVNAEPTSDPHCLVRETVDSTRFSGEFFVVQTSLSDGKLYKSQPLTIGRALPRWQHIRWSEIIRREWILLDKFAGIPSIVFRKRDYGTRCPNCWDARNEKIVKDHCEVCYGTSFVGGYYTGIKTLVQYDSTNDNRKLTYFGKFEPNGLIGWTIAYPTIQPHDIIIRLSDYRIFRVEALQNTEMMTAHLRQIMQLVELPRLSIENKLLHNAETVELRPRPPHQHS